MARPVPSRRACFWHSCERSRGVRGIQVIHAALFRTHQSPAQQSDCSDAIAMFFGATGVDAGSVSKAQQLATAQTGKVLLSQAQAIPAAAALATRRAIRSASAARAGRAHART